MAGDRGPGCPELFLWTSLLEGWFPTFVFLLCRDQGGSKKPTDNSQVGTGSPAQKETRPSPLVVPSAKQDSGMKDISFAFILLVRQGAGVSAARHRVRNMLVEMVPSLQGFLLSLTLLWPCSAFIWRAVIPQGEGLGPRSVPLFCKTASKISLALSCTNKYC